MELSGYSGFVLCVALAVPAYFLGRLVPIVGGPIFGILIGILLANLRRPHYLEKGISHTSRYMLQGSIILLGFGMNLYQILAVGGGSLFVMVFTLAAAFATALLAGKIMVMRGNIPILVGVGTAICGGSAIAATAPVIKASDKDIAFSISTIFLFNIVAVFLFPAAGHLLGMTDSQFGMWAGTAINDTSSVVAAGYVYSGDAGDYATIVKLTRTLMIIPITLALSIVITRTRKSEGKGEYSFMKIFPWFIMGFVLTAVIATSGVLPGNCCSLLSELGKVMIIVAMVAVGLNTKLRELIKGGRNPLILGLCCWIAVTATALMCIYGLSI